jgi:hypothetical protein
MALSDIMGGRATTKSYGVHLNYSSQDKEFISLYNSIPNSHKDWLSSLPSYRAIDVGGKQYYLIHAGLSKSGAERFKDQKDDESMMNRIDSANNSRNLFFWTTPDLSDKNNSLYHFKNAVQILGHKPVKDVVIRDHFIALDTGCGTCAPNKLSAVILPSMEVISVPRI